MDFKRGIILVLLPLLLVLFVKSEPFCFGGIETCPQEPYSIYPNFDDTTECYISIGNEEPIAADISCCYGENSPSYIEYCLDGVPPTDGNLETDENQEAEQPETTTEESVEEEPVVGNDEQVAETGESTEGRTETTETGTISDDKEKDPSMDKELTDNLDVGENPVVKNEPQSTKEVCDGIDNNLNGVIDDGVGILTCSRQQGVCYGSISNCVNGRWQECNSESYGEYYVEYETSAHCDDLDNDCDGIIDEACNCKQGETKSCGIDQGICEKGIQICENGVWQQCRNQVLPQTEICNGFDDDCDGYIDESEHNQGDYSMEFDCNIDSCQGVIRCTEQGMTECIIDDDPDSDTICSMIDNCPDVANPSQDDKDGDAVGDACDLCERDPKNDKDSDGICGDIDNCPNTKNPGQEDNDLDGKGNVCDICPNDPNDDADSDGICGDIDNCKLKPNPEQLDCDNDGIGDACDFDSSCLGDSDDDDILDNIDNCVLVSNPQQMDHDGDGIGDACDDFVNDPFNDADKDLVGGDIDNCPYTYNINQTDTDKDGRGDACDNCPDDEYDDEDSDGICGNQDNCKLDFNPIQSDCDNNGIGDACDIRSDCVGDSDKDNIKDYLDNCLDKYNPGQEDADGDLIGDACDFCAHDVFNDADSDGICGDVDNCPETYNPGQLDTDKDGIGDSCDI